MCQLQVMSRQAAFESTAGEEGVRWPIIFDLQSRIGIQIFNIFIL